MFGKSNADSSGTPYLTPPTLTRSFQFDLRHPRSFPKHSTQHHGVRLPSSHLDHLILLASSCYLYKPLFLFKLYLRQRSRFFPKNSLRTLESPIFGHFELLPTTESINPYTFLASCYLFIHFKIWFYNRNIPLISAPRPLFYMLHQTNRPRCYALLTQASELRPLPRIRPKVPEQTSKKPNKNIPI
jgi:hypothetical protein